MNSPIRRLQARTQRGVTLIESLVVLTIGAIVLGATVPSFEQARERRQLDGIAAQLETDLQYARSLAVARDVTVRVSFGAISDASCYVVHTGAAGACQCSGTETPTCTAGTQMLQHTAWTSETPVRLQANARSIAFDASRGTVTPTATIKLQGAHGAVHQIINIMGRVRTCSPAPALPGHRAC